MIQIDHQVDGTSNFEPGGTKKSKAQTSSEFGERKALMDELKDFNETLAKAGS